MQGIWVNVIDDASNDPDRVASSLEAAAQRLWRGLPLFWKEELRLFEAYERAVGQELTEEGLQMWFTRVQARQCPVAGAGCQKPKRGRFCEHHRPLLGKLSLPEM